jgi:hypothetical protein
MTNSQQSTPAGQFRQAHIEAWSMISAENVNNVSEEAKYECDLRFLRYLAQRTRICLGTIGIEIDEKKLGDKMHDIYDFSRDPDLFKKFIRCRVLVSKLLEIPEIMEEINNH